MIVRQATLQDAPAIAAIWNAEIRDGVNTFNAVEKTLDEIQTTIDARGPKLQVAEQAGQVIGFATVAAFRGGCGAARCVRAGPGLCRHELGNRGRLPPLCSPCCPPPSLSI